MPSAVLAKPACRCPAHGENVRGDRRELGTGKAFAWSHALLKRERAEPGLCPVQVVTNLIFPGRDEPLDRGLIP